jgi:hypothetical protein
MRGETLRKWVIGHKTVTLVKISPVHYRVEVHKRSGSSSSFGHETRVAADKHFEYAIRC